MRSTNIASALVSCRWVCWQLFIIFALVGCGSGGGDEAPAPSGTSPTLIASFVANVGHYEVVFDASRSRLYAAGPRIPSGATLIAIDAQTGASRELPARTRLGGSAPTYYWPGLISLSSSGRFLYFINDSYQLARFDLNNEVVDFVVPPPSPWGPNVRVERIVASPIDDMTVYAEVITEVPSGATFTLDAKPEYLADGILLGSTIYDFVTLAERSTIASTFRCTALGNGTRLACHALPPPFQDLHRLFVYDRATAQRTSEWSAGFTGTRPGAITAAGAGKVAVSYGVDSRFIVNFPGRIAIYSDPAFN